MCITLLEFSVSLGQSSFFCNENPSNQLECGISLLFDKNLESMFISIPINGLLNSICSVQTKHHVSHA